MLTGSRPESRTLILSFDVNGTILINDAAGGKSMQDVINVALAKTCFGVVDEPSGLWIAKTLAPHHDNNENAQNNCEKDAKNELNWAPADAESDEERLLGPSALAPQDERYTSYVDYVQDSNPFVSSLNASIDSIGEQRALVKRRRSEIMSKFTDEGEPGHLYRPYFDFLVDKMKAPVGEARASSTTQNGDDVGTYYAILPAFFELLLHLKATKCRFMLLFRTFGDDLNDIVGEFNQFAAGKHPLYPSARFDGSDGGPDYRIGTENRGVFFRSSASDVSLVLGTWKTVPKIKEGLAFYDGNADVRGIISSYTAIYEHLSEWARKGTGHAAFAIRDYFQFWNSKRQRFDAGKLLLIDSSDIAVHPIFFDDNASMESFFSPARRFIIDARSVRSSPVTAAVADADDSSESESGDDDDDENGDSLCIEPTTSINKYIVQAVPIYAISDSRYFIKCVALAEANRQADKSVGLSASGNFSRLFDQMRQQRASEASSSSPN
jgi:hypothetical protein